jgi:hypothetical protein
MNRPEAYKIISVALGQCRELGFETLVGRASAPSARTRFWVPRECATPWIFALNGPILSIA